MKESTRNRFSDRKDKENLSAPPVSTKSAKEYYKTSYNKKTSTPRTDSHNNVTMKLNILECGKTLGNTKYDIKSMYDILTYLKEREVFRIVSIPVYIYNADIRNDESKKGSRVVGYIRDFNIDTNEVSVTIFGNSTYQQKIDSFKNPILYCRCSIRDYKVSAILSLVVCDQSRYQHLMPNY